MNRLQFKVHEGKDAYSLDCQYLWGGGAPLTALPSTVKERLVQESEQQTPSIAAEHSRDNGNKSAAKEVCPVRHRQIERTQLKRPTWAAFKTAAIDFCSLRQLTQFLRCELHLGCGFTFI